jgi:hypothetical protein
MTPHRCARCRALWRALPHDPDRCGECGVHKDRRVMSLNSARRRNIGGKRGRNSGKVSQHGTKG